MLSQRDCTFFPSGPTQKIQVDEVVLLVVLVMVVGTALRLFR
jgi:hypothetical protein